MKIDPLLPHPTHKRNLDHLSGLFDAKHGAGSAEALLAESNYLTFKQQVAFLLPLVAAAAAAPGRAEPNPQTNSQRVGYLAGAQVKPPAVAPALPIRKTIGRVEYLKLSPFDRGLFQANGGKVVASTMKRSEFDLISSEKRLEFCKSGGTLV